MKPPKWVPAIKPPRIARSGERYPQQIDRAPSSLLAGGVPWLSVMLASLIPGWAIIASAPIVPPLGLMVLLGWRLLRPGLLPLWAGLPLGLFDDLFSGQPLGSAVLLWSLAMIVLEAVETRFPWRNFLQDWMAAAGLLTAAIFFGTVFANLSGGSTRLSVMFPQLAVAVLGYPLIARLVALLDRFRLLNVRELG